MQATILQKIVADKVTYLAARKLKQPLASFIAQVKSSERNFFAALAQTKLAFILECKKASPSKGIIRHHFDPVQIAKDYQNYATAISVLTDEKYFHGSFDYLRLVSNTVPQPILCKDFIIDPYQIYLARFYQADAILLMLSILDNQTYLSLAALADKLKMGILTEVSNEQELKRAIRLKANIVGINNRDLHDLSTDLNRTKQFAPQLAAKTLVISESGIHNHQQIRQLSKQVDGFLIGSALMGEENLMLAIRRLIIGDNKVCGLTRPQDAQCAYQVGAIYGGLIFADKSPRKVTLQQAQTIIKAAPLNYVGVFQHQANSFIAEISHKLSLFAVQLHGDKTAADLQQLRTLLPANCEIWQAVNMSKTAISFNLNNIDRYLLDHGEGGTGKTFDWSKLPLDHLEQIMLAGGLNANNCQQAAALGCRGLDFNSGAEHQPGIKSCHKLQIIFEKLFNYL
ncbi:bifunctional indole-3-glycerol-phosphate synthase TrpC/phosphoribosylanthranilate isomerase TrpF [Arsenophonus nasoniae]|uniref:Multifunctional fusion protein n=1 Tax=Arsenophonus nasoniae TaxID=638 RepID=A0A4P7KUB3_9GAMM|nr:bifunctional indole-3-glycerol-phosphate synthase TrpC/phosphoribosylanthranilate isomerase TrpF [Arsenophonus nasoniae]QBY43416.1 Tryptophan biosynthesis protein TrpCF [Arsenophonus nasoniae]WGM07407.1 bifunctional indole-3-glycerol-phosphate synthase TrpC/phosphoribosylanthranilate isomerase TrpF [Arsenophonus nasoniae]WGM12278.1 bifunctional indole-3-glycerol-phosphate synthase TrpC/phosphoribosylanthranilate isomerase TrpF [Arsenophonus nasoniae]WGM16957.1 bifunctional indole-3-glycerol-